MPYLNATLRSAVFHQAANALTGKKGDTTSSAKLNLVIPALQTEPAFGRDYAAYGGIFIILSILWGYGVDGWRPDRFDLLGAVIALIGVVVIMWGRQWF